MRTPFKATNNRHPNFSTNTTAMLPIPLIIVLWVMCGFVSAQQVLIARPQRSIYGDSPFGWNSLGGISPIGLGHMTKDELLTLLEAWREVEGDQPAPVHKPTEADDLEPAVPPATTPAPAPPPPPPPPPPPRPAVELPPPRPTRPLTVRLPAFVPIQLSAMYTPPFASGGSIDGVTSAIAGQMLPEAAPRIFRFMNLPIESSRSRAGESSLVRNTLDSVDVGTSPAAKRIKPNVQSNSNSVTLTSTSQVNHPSKPRFVVPPPPPFLGHWPGPLELVPSSQLLSNWH